MRKREQHYSDAERLFAVVTRKTFFVSAVLAAAILDKQPAIHNFAAAPVDQQYRMAKIWAAQLTDKAEDQLNVIWSDIKSRMPKTPDAAQQPGAPQNTPHTYSL